MLRRSFLVLAGSVLLTACGGDKSPTGPGAAIAGSYTLQTVNGNPLPWRFLVVGNDWLEVTGGSGSLNADGTYSFAFNYRQSVSGQVSTSSESDVGTYTLNGSAISFTSAKDGTRANGTVNGTQISVTDQDGFVYVLRRN